MNALITLMQEKETHFSQHVFFDIVNKTPLDCFFKMMSRHLTFWVCVFQDLLDMIPEAIQDAQLKKIALHHRNEDKGHHHWFFDDLKKNNSSPLSIEALFSADNQTSRFLIYKILGIYDAITDDYLRVMFLLGLETVGHVFFEKLSLYTTDHKLNDGLSYFSTRHLMEEKNHQAYENETQDFLKAHGLSDAQLQEGTDMLKNLFEQFDAFFHLMGKAMVVEYVACPI